MKSNGSKFDEIFGHFEESEGIFCRRKYRIITTPLKHYLKRNKWQIFGLIEYRDSSVDLKITRSIQPNSNAVLGYEMGTRIESF